MTEICKQTLTFLADNIIIVSVWNSVLVIRLKFGIQNPAKTSVYTILIIPVLK